MISKTQTQTTINPRRSHFVYKPVHYYQPQPQPQPYQQEAQWCDLSRFPDSLSNDDALTFEGKEFHYLDSTSSSFEDIADSFDTQDTADAQTGFSVGADGRFCGFEMFPTYI